MNRGHMKTKLVGHWRLSETGDMSALAWCPWPKSSETPFEGKEQFLKRLRFVQSVLKYNGYRGLSETCRLCNKPNGSREYTAGGWNWPSGFIHYVEEHNVMPDKDFMAWVEEAEVNFKVRNHDV